MKNKEKVLDLLNIVYKTRFIDDKMNNLVKQNKGSSFFLTAKGHEIIGAAASLFLKKKKDWAFPYYRDRAMALGLGCCPIDIFAAFLAREIPHHSGGRMMLDHFSHVDNNIPCQSSVVGSQFLQAVGLAKSSQLRNSNEIVYVSGGDGSTSQGDFHEALNFSSIHKLPVIFVIQDNGWAISTKAVEQTTGGCVSNIPKGYKDLDSYLVNGTDIEALLDVFEKSSINAREKSRPSVVVVKVPRLGPHTISDDPKKYKDAATVLEEEKNDPLRHLEEYILEKRILSLEEMKNIASKIKEDVQKAADEAEKFPFPHKDTAHTKVFKELDEEIDFVSYKDNDIVMMDGLNKALQEEMEKDPHIVVFGQDVAHGKGGVFGITRGLSEKFGKNRCFNTPLAESTIIGLATGLCFDGKHKPVCEIQFADYSWTGMNQIVNELSSIYYRSNGKWNCPVVIRMPFGGYIQGGPYHSQSIESIFTHIPGLKVVVPSNAADAKMLLKTAIKDPNPVIFLEHKALYRQKVYAGTKEPCDKSYLPFGKANIVKKGEQVTLLCWGLMVMMANEVAKELEKEGLSVEVIDLRTLIPLDMETILTSIKKTSKVLIVQEACKTSGFASELSARIAESSFHHLDAPIMRVAAKDCPVPFCKDLENEVLPQKSDIKKAIFKLSSY